MPVSDKHKLYNENITQWTLIRDCIEGSKKIKERRAVDGKNTNTLSTEMGSAYLPVPNPTDNSQENRERFRAYVKRANFVNFTAQTKDGFMGMVSRKKSIIELDPAIKPLEKNSDGAGLSLQELIQRVTDETLITARYGLLADYPVSEEGQTLAQTADINPYIACYTAESIINWRTSTINGVTMLTLVVLEEDIEEELEDGFTVECKKQYRVLRLNEGVYTQQLYDHEDKPKTEEFSPRKSDGSTWPNIPFQFVGAVDNNPSPDKSVLYDLAEVNLSHYRNSADFEESSFMVGQPTPALAGLNQAWVDEVLKGKIHLGSRGGIMLPEGGTASLLQANPNQMPSEGMKIKEEQMIKIGAKIIVDNGGNETAEAAKIRFSGQNSKLGTIVSNVENGVTQALEWCGEFAGARGENEIRLNREFYDARIDPQLLIAKIQLLDRQVISIKDMRDGLRDGGLIDEDRTDEDIESDLREVSPLQ